MNKTPIPWADSTWNPTTGCTFGCDYCYARKVAQRFCSNESGHEGVMAPCDGLCEWCSTIDGPEFVGQPVRYARAFDGAFPYGFMPTVYDHRLDEPLRRKKPAVIFLGSMGDVFDPAIPDNFRDRIFATVAAAPQHTFVVLTKRAAAMREYFADCERRVRTADLVNRQLGAVRFGWPLANLVIGVSVTNQADADERIPLLSDTPAARRMVSVEPMLGPLKMRESWLYPNHADIGGVSSQVALDFVAVGGKTPGKPLHEGPVYVRIPEVTSSAYDGRPPFCENVGAQWLRNLRDQCLAAGVPFHYKAGGKNPALDGVVYDARLAKGEVS